MNQQDSSADQEREWVDEALGGISDYTIHRVGDVAPSVEAFEGQKVKVRQLVDKTFTVLRIVELSGEHGPYVGVQIEGEGKPFFFFSGHKVIRRKLAECIGSEPLLATITRVDPNGEGNPYFDIA